MIFVQACVVLLSFVNYFLKSFQGSVQMLTLENVTPYLVYESFLLLSCRQSLKRATENFTCIVLASEL